MCPGTGARADPPKPGRFVDRGSFIPSPSPLLAPLSLPSALSNCPSPPTSMTCFGKGGNNTSTPKGKPGQKTIKDTRVLPTLGPCPHWSPAHTGAPPTLGPPTHWGWSVWTKEEAFKERGEVGVAAQHQPEGPQGPPKCTNLNTQVCSPETPGQCPRPRPLLSPSPHPPTGAPAM